MTDPKQLMMNTHIKIVSTQFLPSEVAKSKEEVPYAQ